MLGISCHSLYSDTFYLYAIIEQVYQYPRTLIDIGKHCYNFWYFSISVTLPVRRDYTFKKVHT